MSPDVPAGRRPPYRPPTRIPQKTRIHKIWVHGKVWVPYVVVKFHSGTSVLSERWVGLYPVRMNRQQGTVKWFSRDKGWGFVRLEDGSEIFIHHTDIEGDGRKTLEDDERIEFSIERMDKGPRARNVRRLDSQAMSPAKTQRGGRGNRRDGGGTGGSRQRSTRNGKATTRTKTPDHPVPLAQQLRKRLARLFPGIGS